MAVTALSATLSGGAIAGIVIGAIVGFVLLFFALTFTLYWFNVDMKFMRWFYKKMQKHYDNIERDRKI